MEVSLGAIKSIFCLIVLVTNVESDKSPLSLKKKSVILERSYLDLGIIKALWYDLLREFPDNASCKKVL